MAAWKHLHRVWELQMGFPGSMGKLPYCQIAANRNLLNFSTKRDAISIRISLIAISYFSAYKEKMKELSLLSLICSCFHTQPHPNTIYQYGGR